MWQLQKSELELIYIYITCMASGLSTSASWLDHSFDSRPTEVFGAPQKATRRNTYDVS